MIEKLLWSAMFIWFRRTGQLRTEGVQAMEMLLQGNKSRSNEACQGGGQDREPCISASARTGWRQSASTSDAGQLLVSPPPCHAHAEQCMQQGRDQQSSSQGLQAGQGIRRSAQPSMVPGVMQQGFGRSSTCGRRAAHANHDLWR